MNIYSRNRIKITTLVIATFLLVHFNIFTTYGYIINDLSDRNSGIAVEQISTENLMSSPSAGNTGNTLESKTNIIASFYPIYELVRKVGKDNVAVESLIPIGIEPHDYEPTVQQIQRAENADLIIYNGGSFEGRWINGINNENKLNLVESLNFTSPGNSSMDPHIWLDPILVKEQVNIIKNQLTKLDPTNANYYEQNARDFIHKLDSLDSFIKQSLSTCEKKDFISFHNAFSYFANRYNLTSHSISQTTGPEGEILPQRIPEVIQLAQHFGINTIYAEEMIDPRSAQVIAQEIPEGNVLILSPIEGVTEDEQNSGIGYIEKMKQNINNLKIGLKCLN